MAEELRQIVVDGVSMEIDARDAQVIERAFRTLEDAAQAATDQAENFKKKFGEEEEEKKKKKEEKDAADATIKDRDAVIVTKDAEIESLKKQLADATSPAAIDRGIALRASVLDAAKLILSDKVDLANKSNAEVRKLAVETHLGDMAERAKNWDDREFASAFDSITAGIVKDAKKAAPDPIKDAAAAFAKPHFGTDSDAGKEAAYRESVQSLGDAWKRKAS